MPRITAVVLAAGRAQRFGGGKLLANVDGRPLLLITIHEIKSVIDDIVVVLGAVADEVERSVAAADVRFIRNERYLDGMGTSIAAGAAALTDDVDGVLIALGDQPVPRAVVAELRASFDGNPDRIIVPVYGGMRGNPVLFGRARFPELQRLTGDRGARDLIEQQRGNTIAVPFDGPPPIDVDTPEDLERVREVFREKAAEI